MYGVRACVHACVRACVHVQRAWRAGSGSYPVGQGAGGRGKRHPCAEQPRHARDDRLPNPGVWGWGWGGGWVACAFCSPLLCPPSCPLVSSPFLPPPHVLYLSFSSPPPPSTPTPFRVSVSSGDPPRLSLLSSEGGGRVALKQADVRVPKSLCRSPKAANP